MSGHTGLPFLFLSFLLATLPLKASIFVILRSPEVSPTSFAAVRDAFYAQIASKAGVKVLTKTERETLDSEAQKVFLKAKSLEDTARFISTFSSELVVYTGNVEKVKDGYSLHLVAFHLPSATATSATDVFIAEQSTLAQIEEDAHKGLSDFLSPYSYKSKIFPLQAQSGLAQESPKAAQFVRLGDQAWAKNQWKQAYDNYSRALALAPTAQIFYKRGLAARELHDYSRAYDDFSFSLDKRPSSETLFQRGLTALLWDKKSGGEADLAAVIAASPQDTRARLLLATLYDKRGEGQRAYEQYVAVLKYDPKNQHVREQLAALLARNQYYEASKKVYLSLLKDYPTVSTYGKAVQDLEKSSNKGINSLPWNVPWLDKNFHQTVLDYAQIFEDERAYRLTSSSYPDHKKSDIKKEIAGLSTQIQSHLSDEALYKKRGKLYFDDGQFVRAYSDFSQAVGLNPHDPMLFYSRALTLIQQVRYHEALSDLNQAISLSPQASFYEWRGFTWERLNQPEKARLDYKQAVMSDPNNKNSLYRLAFLDQNIYLYKEAEVLASRLIRLEPKNPRGFLLLGSIYEYNQQPQVAEKAYRAVLGFQKNNKTALQRLGAIYAKQRPRPG